MYHFDYVGRGGGTVFEGKGGDIVSYNGQKKFSFSKFLSTFVLIENYKHPFTMTVPASRLRRLSKQIIAEGYVGVELEQIDFDFRNENAYVYGFYHASSRNVFEESGEE